MRGVMCVLMRGGNRRLRRRDVERTRRLRKHKCQTQISDAKQQGGYGFRKRQASQQVRSLIFGLVIVLLPSLAPAEAEDRQGTLEEREACTPDALRLCSSYIPNAHRIAACLRENIQSLSEPCRVVMTGRDPAKQKSDPK